MEPDRQDLRRASARAFFESLDQMNELARAQEASQNSQTNPQPANSPAAKRKKPKAQFSFAELEEAIADIEQFMQSREEKGRDGGDGGDGEDGGDGG